MELVRIVKSISEQKPLLVSACFALKGERVTPKDVEDILRNDELGGHSLEQVLGIAAFDSIFDFIEQCKEQKYRTLSGTLAIAMANFMMKRISLKTSFIRDGLEPTMACAELDQIFVKQTASRSLAEFLRTAHTDLSKLELLSRDNEVFLYLVIAFYLYVYEDSVLLLRGNYATLLLRCWDAR
ncbi:hypothetical protein AGMMS49975_23950 [Clostridia bacterium]|nr:hypothetical protein AGMMS49975_23950 [Clostridia bacterium]